MKLLEQIIRKALFQSNRRLVEQSSKWTLDRLKKSVANKVNQLGTKAVVGFTIDLEGDDLNVDNAGATISSWLTKLANLKPTSDFEQPGENSKVPVLNQYSNGSYFLVYGKDTVQSRSEKQASKKQTAGKGYHNSYNVIVFPIENLRSILTNEDIDKVGVNAWKYPAAKGTEFAEPRRPGQLMSTAMGSNADLFGTSPIIFSAELSSQRDEYQKLLPIAREMRNTPQPGASPTRNKDIETAIALMESFINDFPDWKELTKIISPNSKQRGFLAIGGTGTGDFAIKSVEYEQWDATNSKQAAEIQNQMTGQRDAEGAAADQAAQGFVDVVDQPYKYNGVNYIFNGKWNKDTEQPIEGVLKDSTDTDAEERFNGVWDENGVFKTGKGIFKGSNGTFDGVIINGKPNGYGVYTMNSGYVFTGNVKPEGSGFRMHKGKLVYGDFANRETSEYFYFNGTFGPVGDVVAGESQRSWVSTETDSDPNKLSYFDGNVSGGVWTNGDYYRYKLENGKSVEYMFTGTFSDNKPYSGTVTKDGQDFGKIENGVFTTL
jgi:hypothetical protein